MPSRSAARPELRDLAAEIIRRAAVLSGNGTQGGYVVRLSKPPTWHEQLQLVAACLERRPIAIMPHKCATMDEWVERYRALTRS